MCQQCQVARDRGYIETIKFKCGVCGKDVPTEWKVNGGLLHGHYCLIGDVLFHEACSVEYLRPLEERAPRL